MKKILTTVVACVSLLAFASSASAQIEGVGVMGGFTSSVAPANGFDASSISTYHAGITRKFNLGLGFAFQPSLTYQMKGTALDYSSRSNSDMGAATNLGQTLLDGVRMLDASVGYVELPCQFQWGPDLMAFRPYLLVEPFIGFGVTMNAKSDVFSESVSNGFKDVSMSRWEYGFGIGGGIEIWRFQLSGRYFWNFGGLCDDQGNINPSNMAKTIRSAFENQRGFNGFNLTMTFFFGPRN